MDELNDGGFLFRYPVWMVDHPTRGAKGIINLPGPAGERAFVLFTDEDLAARFRASDGRLAEYALVPIPTREALDDVRRVLETGKFTHVIFDHPGSGVPLGVGAKLVEIATVRRRIRPGATARHTMPVAPEPITVSNR